MMLVALANILSAKNADQRFATQLHSLGKRDLLKNKWTAFFCSVRCPGNLILKAYDLAQKWRAENQPVIGGFHSPVEQNPENPASFNRAGLYRPRPVFAEAHSIRIPPPA